MPVAGHARRRVCASRFGGPLGHAQLAMKGAHNGLVELAQFGHGHLGALRDIGGIEGQDVAGGDTVAVERGQQVREMVGWESVGQDVVKIGHHRNSISWGASGQTCRHLTGRECRGVVGGGDAPETRASVGCRAAERGAQAGQQQRALAPRPAARPSGEKSGERRAAWLGLGGVLQ